MIFFKIIGIAMIVGLAIASILHWYDEWEVRQRKD